jgi:hypothetical protein
MKKRLPAQVVLAIMTTITVVVWVGFSVYQEFRNKPEPIVTEDILEPISPELDADTLAKIEEKLYFEKGSTVPFSSQSAIINLEPKVTVTPTASESAGVTEEILTEASASAEMTQ